MHFSLCCEIYIITKAKHEKNKTKSTSPPASKYYVKASFKKSHYSQPVSSTILANKVYSR